MTRTQKRLANFYQWLRIRKFRLLSDCPNIIGKPTLFQPVQFMGKGTIRFNGNVTLGWFPAPFFFNGCIYLEARSETSVIQIEDGVVISNNSVLVSDGPGIFIGKNTMLGVHSEVLDSDFHDLHPERRRDGVAKTGKVVIGENVLIGSNARVLKGVRIGNNSIIANGSVITRTVPEDVVAFGNPARAGLGLVHES